MVEHIRVVQIAEAGACRGGAWRSGQRFKGRAHGLVTTAEIVACAVRLSQAAFAAAQGFAGFGKRRLKDEQVTGARGRDLLHEWADVFDQGAGHLLRGDGVGMAGHHVGQRGSRI